MTVEASECVSQSISTTGWRMALTTDKLHGKLKHALTLRYVVESFTNVWRTTNQLLQVQWKTNCFVCGCS